MERRLISSGGPIEEQAGYSRAVVVGKQVFVAGTCAFMPDGSTPPNDAYEQAMRILEVITGALREAGAEPAHVVRTRIYITRAEDFDAISRAHKEVFGEARPAATAVVVTALAHPEYLVEIEADAILP